VAAYGSGEDVVKRYVNETAPSDQDAMDWDAVSEFRT